MAGNKKRPPEKDMPVFLEVKGLEAICIEGTIFEVMDNMIFKEMGKRMVEVMIIETERFEEKGSEETLSVAMGKLFYEVKCFEGIYVIYEKYMDLIIEVKGIEASNFEATSIEVMG